MVTIHAMVDVVVVGAGAAGLAAANTLEQNGWDVQVLEAGDRLGGRGLTDRSTFGRPWDAGCRWLHSASTNPWRDIADLLDFPYLVVEPQTKLWSGARFEPEQVMDEAYEYAGRCWDAAAEAAARGEDVPLSQVLPKTNALQSRFFAHWCAVLNGVSPRRSSTLDQARFEDTEENWPVVGGFGALMELFGRALPVQLNASVERIDRRSSALTVESSKGTLSARAVIVTVSTAVLAKERIRFSPPLPEPVRDAIAGLPLGRCNKAAIHFEKDIFGLAEHTYLHFLPRLAPPIDVDLERAGEGVIATGYFSGALSDDLEKVEGAMVFALKAALVEMFGREVLKHCGRSTSTAWGQNPRFGGAYSAAAPGKAKSREVLAAPIDERLFFAGEATSIDAYATAHGAYRSGVRAARAAIQALSAAR